MGLRTYDPHFLVGVIGHGLSWHVVVNYYDYNSSLTPHTHMFIHASYQVYGIYVYTWLVLGQNPFVPGAILNGCY